MAIEKTTVEPQKSPFADRLHSYMKNFAQQIGIKETPLGQQEKALRIIDRNNRIAGIIESEQYRSIVKEEMQLRGDAKLGYVYCIDGRIPTIFLAGRFANAWEEPAGLIGRHKGVDGKYTPLSTLLNEALNEVAGEDRDLLEIFFAHTGSIEKPNGCGYMNQLQQDGEIPLEADLTAENIRRFDELHIPALTEFYNRARKHKGKEPLKRVGISAVYETEKMGIVLNYGDPKTQMSTSEVVNKNREELESAFGNEIGKFGVMKNSFTNPDNFITFSTNILKLTKHILNGGKLIEIVDQNLSANYSELTASQKQTLRFVLARTMAMQYITGLSEVPDSGAAHQFAHHEEDYLSISLAGKTVGRFDTEEQVFASTPSDTPSAIKHIDLKLNIMDSHGGKRPQVLFVSNPVKKADWDKHKQKESEAIMRNIALNASLFRTIVSNDKFTQRIQEGNLIVIPVLINQNTGEILDVLDHSAYV